MKSGGGLENSTLAAMAVESTLSPQVNLREKIKIEFYKTYDAMTGIRIAATLGGFFSMMILLVLYKNYCKPNKTLSEEQLNAAVTAAAEEEDRALQAALEATSFYTALEKRRESLRNTNPVLLSPRFSSVGGGYSPLTPPVKVLQQRGKSLPGSVMHFGSNSSSTAIQTNARSESLSKSKDFDLYGQSLDYFACRNYLNVLPSRRVSSVTCSSADSAYLERRCSAFELGLPSPSHVVRHSKEKLRERKDFCYPIDIQVIQPTPEMSPTASERNLNEEQSGCSLQVPAFHDQVHRLSVASIDLGVAPLASISSLGSFCSQSGSIAKKSSNGTGGHPAENQGYPSADDSLGSDSVFMDIEDEEFATDSEFEYDGFDDDYSFCETKERPLSRTGVRPLQFVSFDSFDASITQDSVSEAPDKHVPKPTTQPDDEQTFPPRPRLSSTEFKRHLSLHDGTKTARKLMKTYSEPKTTRAKRQPACTEKGGLVPKRQLSSPSTRKNNFPDENDSRDKSLASATTSQDGDSANHPTKFLLPPSNRSTDSVTPTPPPHDPTSSPKQGIDTELPLKAAGPQVGPKNAHEKRTRLQKQKNFVEEVTDAEADKTEGHHLAEKETPGEPSGGQQLSEPATDE